MPTPLAPVTLSIIKTGTGLQVETDLYILDYDPCVMTCAQAFAASLSSFEAKLLI